MTAIAAKKIVTVLLLKAVLLGSPVEPGLEAPAGGYSMPGWGYVIGYGRQGQEEWRVDGDQVLLDADAGLLVAAGPDEGQVRELFDEPRYEYDVREVALHPEADGSWPPATVEFPWPKEGGAYYLEEIEPDLFRRTELATKEGYSVSATFRGQDVLDVELELTRRSFTGGDYEDALDAWTERPMAVKSVVSTTVPLTSDRPTLLVWRSPLNPTERPSLQTSQTESVEPAQTASGPPPEWAVGTWRFRTDFQGDAEDVTMVIRADGTGVISPESEAMQIEVDASGHLTGRLTTDDMIATVKGSVRADRTGSGTIVVEGVDELQGRWTATKARHDAPEDAQTSAPASGMIHLAQFEGDGGLGSTGSRLGVGNIGTGTYVRSSQPKQRDENMRPNGLAVLLELKRWVFEPASQEMRKGFEPLANALSEATDGAATWELQNTQTPSPQHLRVVPVSTKGESVVATVGGEEFTPLLALWLAEEATMRNIWRNEQRLPDGTVAVSYDIGYVTVPPGPCLLAGSTSGSGKLIALIVSEGDLARLPGPSPAGATGLGFSDDPSRPAPAGAPSTAFSSLIGDSREGALFALWAPAREGEDARVSVELRFGGGLGSYGGSSFGSNRGASGFGSGSNRSSGFGGGANN